MGGNASTPGGTANQQRGPLIGCDLMNFGSIGAGIGYGARLALKLFRACCSSIKSVVAKNGC